MKTIPALVLAAVLLTASAHAAAPAPAPPRELAPVLVSGVQPGPPLWKATRDGHVLWILGTVTPAPKRLQWQSREVGKVLDDAGVVLLGARASVTSDIGRFRSLLLLPKALRARRNPGGRTLREVLPPALYARWLPLKARYIGRDDDVEKWRPIFAAQTLYEAALKRQGLTGDNDVAPIVQRLAKRHGVPVRTAEVKLVFRDPKKALAQFAATPLDDIGCLEKTMDRLDADLYDMSARANAWAIGDLATMRALPYPDQAPTCVAAMLGSAVAQSRDLDALPARVRAAWVDAADQALREHPTSLALLPMAEVYKPDGYLAALRARGVVVIAPDEQAVQ
jgi:uncharacterized protein YbaP (TraB family)